MQTLPFEPAAGATCVVERHAVVEVPLSEIPGLRDAAVPVGAPPLPPRFLRHCDEQTVVGVRAVLAAIASRAEQLPDLDRHGVIAAPRLAGRITAAQTLSQVATAGGVAVSPHVVPQCSLHALASAVSVALGMHGPNLGVSGGPRALSEGLSAALSLVQTAGHAGLWVVFTEWEEEPVLDDRGRPTSDPLCRGVALAIAPPAAAETSRVTLRIGRPDRMARSEGPRGPAADTLRDFATALSACGAGGAIEPWAHVCPWGTEIRIVGPAAAVGSEPRDGRHAIQREAA